MIELGESAELGFAGGNVRGRAEFFRAGIETELGPLRPRQGPFVLGALLEAVDVADMELDARFLVPAVLLAFQEMIVEPLLQFAAVFRVVLGPMFEAVDFQPFLLRAGPHVTFDIAAQMQALAADIGAGQERHLNIRQMRRAAGEVVLVERVGALLARQVGAVSRQDFVGQSLGAGDELAGVGTDAAARADAVLHIGHLVRIPADPKRAENAAMAHRVAVEIGRTLEGADRGEVRRALGRHLPLVHRIIGDAR